MTECWYSQKYNVCEEIEGECYAKAKVYDEWIDGTCDELREMWGIPDPEEE